MSAGSLASLPAVAASSCHLVWIRCLTRSVRFGSTDSEWPRWLAACYHLTSRLQRLDPDTVLLDLGVCADAEALAAVETLLAELQRQQVTIRAAIGSSSVLAQLAFLRAPANTSFTLVTAEQTASLLQQSPIGTLTKLAFAGSSTLTATSFAQAVDRLDRYGVRTLAHLARLDEKYLRRQFGTRLGTLLATVARGADPWPLQPTPAPLRLPFRLPMTAPLSESGLLAALAPWTLEVASALAARGLQGQTLELELRWESGATERIARTLPKPLDGAFALEAAVRRMLLSILRGSARRDGPLAIEAVQLTVTDLTPRYPVQDSFWPQRVRRLAAARQLTGVLARRHGKSLIFRSALTAPDAIFDQDRFNLTPLDADVTAWDDTFQDRAPGRTLSAGAGASASANAGGGIGGTGDAAEIPHGIHWW